jgi:uncharacterized protein (TIGR00255 family)
MTGFATADALVGSLQLKWELRSVNHRFLDIGMRLPDELKILEPEFRARLTAEIQRGKVDCSLKLSVDAGLDLAAELDTAKLDELKRLQTMFLAAMPDARPLSVADLLRWPGVLKEPQQNQTELGKVALAAFDHALAELSQARGREGERITGLLKLRVASMRRVMAAVGPMLEDATTRHRHKMLERLRPLDIEVEPDRLEQELALIAQRLDVTEEFDRLQGHLDEIEAVLVRNDPVGRRLDFLIQELNREANTLASKAQDEALTRHAVELKVLIEQMREQVQNLE